MPRDCLKPKKCKQHSTQRPTCQLIPLMQAHKMQVHKAQTPCCGAPAAPPACTCTQLWAGYQTISFRQHNTQCPTCQLLPVVQLHEAQAPAGAAHQHGQQAGAHNCVQVHLAGISRQQPVGQACQGIQHRRAAAAAPKGLQQGEPLTNKWLCNCQVG